MFSINTPTPVYLQAAMKAGFWNGDVAPTSYFDPLNFKTLELTAIKQENDRLLSNMEGSVGEALASVPKPTDPGTFKAEIDTLTETVAAVLLGADVAALNQSSGDITDEVITTLLDLWVPVANQHLSSTGITLKTSGDVVVASTKYGVDTINGLVKAHSCRCGGRRDEDQLLQGRHHGLDLQRRQG